MFKVNSIDCFFNYGTVAIASTPALGRIPLASSIIVCWISYIYMQHDNDQLLCLH